MLNLSKLTIAQKIAAIAILTVAAIWIALEIGIPIAEYFYGKSTLTDFLAKIASGFQILLITTFVVVIVFQRIGVLPTIRNPALEAYEFKPVNHLRNLAIWIVIALVLVFFFNFTQGKSGGGKLMDFLVFIFPLILLVGIWIYIMTRMSKRKGGPPS